MVSVSPINLTVLAQGGAFGIDGSQFALLGLVMLATTVLMISTRRRLQRARNSPRAHVREHVSRLREERQVMGDVESIMVQLDALARDITGKMDVRFAKLEKSIRDADARIDRLQRLIRTADGEPTIDVTVGGDETPPPALPSTPPTPSRFEEIHSLHACGLTPVQIAERLGQATGEVELILALHGASADPRSQR